MPTTNKKPVIQKKWVKGLISCTPNLAQVPGSVPRITNMLYTVRGGLKTCDGTDIVTQPNLTAGPVFDTTGHGPFLEIKWTPPGLISYNNVPEIALQVAPSFQIAKPTGLALSAVASGNVPAGTYTVYLTASDGMGETTAASAMITLGDSIHNIGVTWNSVTSAAGYNLYLNDGTTTILVNYHAGLITGNSYTITGVHPTTPVVVPTVNTTEVTVARTIYDPGTAQYSDNTILPVASSPSPIFFLPGSPVGRTNFSQVVGQNVSVTPNGGIVGAMSATPSIQLFHNNIILILGNGIPPMYWTPSGFAPLPNNFVVSYPTWLTNTSFSVGDLIIPATPNGFYFQCTQAGVSGGSEPSWPSTVGATIADGSVLWICVASTSVIAPRGAAHAVVYAGSLWLWNTYPITTTDNLDGPSCLKMSVLADPTKWDPLNVAFVDKDDGDEGMGMAVFSISEAGISPQNNLILFKSYKSYVVGGVFGSTNFSIQRVQTDMGCIAPNSIQFVPGLGVVRFTHLGFASTDGISDKVISEEIRPYLFGGDPLITPIDMGWAPYAQATQVANPPMYICGFSRGNNSFAINTLFCYDLTTLSWTIVALPFNIYNIEQIRPGALASTPGGFISYLTQLGAYTDGIIRNWQNGDLIWDHCEL